MGKKNTSGVRKVIRGGKPRWFIDFRFTDKKGVRQRFRRDASVQNYAAAVGEAARLMKRAAETGIVEETAAQTETSKAVTYRDFVTGPFESVFMPGYRPATARRYRELHDQRVMEFFGAMPLDAIGPREYRKFAAVLNIANVQTKGPMNLVRTVIRAAFDEGYIDKLPEFPKGLIKTGKKVLDAPSTEEVDAMLKAPGWLGVAIALAALAGMRMGEVRALEVRDIEFDQHRIIVRRALSEDSSLKPKSGDERIVPLAVGLEVRLREAVKSKLPKARVVIDPDGQTPRRQQVLYKFKQFLRQNSLKERSFHSLRHYFVTELMRSGASAEVVRVLAGHSKLEMTQRYAHATQADQRAAIDKLGR